MTEKTPDPRRPIALAIAKQCLARCDGLGEKGKRRDNMVVEFYAGAAAAIVAANGERDPLAQMLLAHFALIAAPRGHAGIVELAKRLQD